MHVIRHEIGHGLAVRSGKQIPYAWPEEVRRLVEGKVSGRALESPMEFVAEVFAALKYGRQMPEEVLLWYNEWGGGEP